MKVLMYHYIREYDLNLPDLKFLHVKDFAKQLDYLEEEYGFIERSAFIDSIKNNNSCPEGVILTFDDGLKDHFSYVLPELLKRNLWGIFYVSSGVYHQSKMLSVQKIQYMLAKYGAKRVLKKIDALKDRFKNLDKGVTEIHKDKVYLNHGDNFEEISVKKILNYHLDPHTKDELCSHLLDAFNESEEKLSEEFYLNKDEIKIMHEANMIIGSHGVNHHPMINLSLEESKNEIENSLYFLENLLPSNMIKTFCYPHGLPHTFRDSDVETLKENKVDFSFAVESRDLIRQDISNKIHSLPRFDCNEFKYGSAFCPNK